MGAVEVQVTPLQLTPGKQPVFKISPNTHSVELNYDYSKINTLTDNEGTTYQAENWT